MSNSYKLLVSYNAISSKDAHYYLMQLDADKGEVSITPFSKKQLEVAESIYRLQEIENVDKPHIELVLMITANFKDIQKAYPNYFLDSKAFIEQLTKICKSLI